MANELNEKKRKELNKKERKERRSRRFAAAKETIAGIFGAIAGTTDRILIAGSRSGYADIEDYKTNLSKVKLT